MDLVPVTLQGFGLTLRPLASEDLVGLCRIGLEPSLWKFTAIRVSSPGDMAAYVQDALADRAAGTALPFVISESGGGDVVGSTRLHSWSAAARQVEIGYTWIHPGWQRTFVNTAAKFLLLQHAFESLACSRVEFKATEENAPSIRALERLGARPDRVLMNHFGRGYPRPRNLRVFRILQTEWPDIKADLQGKLAAPTSTRRRNQ